MGNQGIYLKFNTLIVGTIFFCGMIIGGMLLRTTSTSLEEGLINTGQEVATGLAVTISNDILLDDRFNMQERLYKTMETNSQVRYIIVSYPDGRMMTSTFIYGLPKGLPEIRLPHKYKGIDDMVFGSSEGRIREVMVPIDDGLIGYVRVGMSEKEMTRELQNKCLQAVVAVLVVCIIASILATRYALAFLKPIRKLSFAVKQLDKGNYGIQVPIYSTDETGKLAETFNKMSLRLRHNIEENNRLLQALQEKEKDREWLISQLFSAREDEQRRISRELHDESSQSMASILTYLRVLHDRLDTDEQREMLFEIRELTAATLGGIRRLAVDLHPPMLEDLGLAVAIEKYVDPIRRMNPELRIDLELIGDPGDLPKPIALMCYRTFQEGVTNILKHAQATVIQLKLEVTDEFVEIFIKDNGVGFDERDAQRARMNRHLGLVSMKERTELLKGSFCLETSLGQGTQLSVKLPLTIKEEGVDFSYAKEIKNPFS